MFSDSDDDEDITVHRKPHRNAIRDSDSEEEGAAADNSVHMAEALVLSASSGDEMETGEAEEKSERKEKGGQKTKRILHAPIDSEDSEPEQEQQEDVRKEKESTKEQKKREKSQRHREKKEKRSKAVEKLKKKKDRFSETDEVSEVIFLFL